MTLLDLLDLARRRWYVYAVTIALAVTATLVLQSTPRVYSAKAEISFTPPDDVVANTPWSSYVETMINYAGAVDNIFNDTYPAETLSGPRATLFGNGFREGVTVGISKTGSQWMPGYDRPVVVARVNASTEAAAYAELVTTLQRIDAISARIQDEAGTPASLRIQTTWDADQVSVGSFGSTRSSLAKGAAVLMGASMVLATLAALAVDASARRRRRAVASVIPQATVS
ncbi:hypothetical protein [Citricoccus sp.]|uniref:hypothetical protein n=1 Tax=Citricoccus sp. TaxID=1978372 RepID=UPI0028BF249A|nr:hypothetical protein [Citricoccus sp.]